MLCRPHLILAVCGTIWSKLWWTFNLGVVKSPLNFSQISHQSTDWWEKVHLTQLLKVTKLNLNLKDHLYQGIKLSCGPVLSCLTKLNLAQGGRGLLRVGRWLRVGDLPARVLQGLLLHGLDQRKHRHRHPALIETMNVHHSSNSATKYKIIFTESVIHFSGYLRCKLPMKRRIDKI